MKHSRRHLFILVTTLGLVFAMVTHAQSERTRNGTDDQENAKAEIMASMDNIIKGAAFYFSAPKINNDGLKLPCQFPASNEWSPRGNPCDHGGKFSAGHRTWNQTTWAALSFQMLRNHYGQYRIQSSGTLSDATITIFARYKNCQTGTWTTYSQTIFASPESDHVECSIGTLGLLKKDR